MVNTAIIMAGGKGERFWPQSRANLPKQFLSLTADGKTMIQLTVERLQETVDIKNMFVATNEGYRELVHEQLPEVPQENILCEPVAKNTAPCIAYAAAVISARYGDAIMYVMPSDHIIGNIQLFSRTLAQAAEIAQKDNNLVTLGVTPNYPETGYGYIKFDNKTQLEYEFAYPVSCFVEKPDIEKAKQYLSEGVYLWNSGMFIWKASTFLSSAHKYIPNIYEQAMVIQKSEALDYVEQREAIAKAFENMDSVSVDYGILEKARDIYTIPSSFGWDDVGGWLSLTRINPVDDAGNVQKGTVLAIDCKDSVLVSNKRLVAAVDIEGIVVVETEDAVLVCGRDSAQRVKEIVGSLKAKNMQQYL